MLLNLTHHPSAGWPEAQRAAAREAFGEVRDLPFPAIDPAWEVVRVEVLAGEYASRCCDLFQGSTTRGAVHVMGELTFTFALVARLQARGVRCVASTTCRHVEPAPDGSRNVVFRFARFRDYPDLSNV